MSNPHQLVECLNCGAPLGRYCQVGERVWIQIDQVRLYAAHGICAQCGEEWHWVSTEKRLEQMIARAQAHRWNRREVD